MTSNFQTLRQTIGKGCGRYLGLAFDTNNIKVYCGDEIYGGESKGMFIKLCNKCKKKEGAKA